MVRIQWLAVRAQSLDCENGASKLWLEAGHKPAFPMAVATFTASGRGARPSFDEDVIALRRCQDRPSSDERFSPRHDGRLVEALRRRLRLIGLAVPPPSAPASPDPKPLTPAQRARQLT